MAEQTPEEIARTIIPFNYRAETAPTSLVPSMDMVLSSRCAGALRDAIAAALTAYGSSRYAAGHRAGQEHMREAVLMRLPGGTHCDPQEWADDIRAIPIKDPDNG